MNGSSLLKCDGLLLGLTIDNRADDDWATYLLIQSSLNTPLRALALIPGGSTQLIFGPSFCDWPLMRAKPWNAPLSLIENNSMTVVLLYKHSKILNDNNSNK